MNKDVIYIEPEDDITDIIGRLKSSKQKVVALVPPKKLGVLKSAVNNKLIAKAAREAEKVVVMVTPDPSLTKIAISAGLPVAKTLQSRPMMPGDSPKIADLPDEEEIIEEPDDPEEEEPAPDPAATRPKKVKEEPDMELNSSDIEEAEDDEEDKKSSKKAKKIPSFDPVRKKIIIGVVIAILLIGFGVWALVIAPAATITVAIKTTPANFSEDITLVTNNADPASGKIALEKETTTTEASVEFDATGEKDVGEKASGKLTAYYYFGPDEKGTTVSIPSGSTFSYNGLSYVATNGASITRTSGTKECDNDADSIADNGCKISTTVNIEAAASGANYNVDANHTGWTSSVVSASGDQIYVTQPTAISGGTSKVVKVVQASDVARARERLTTDASSSDLKEKLLKQFDSDTYVIENSYSAEAKDPVSTPAIGEELENGKSAKLTASTTATMYGVKKEHLADFIKSLAGSKLPADQKLYDIGDPFLERFDASTMTARLKTTTHSGPKVTEQEILEKSLGRKVGEVQSLLRSINGISSVNIEKSVPWMGALPDDPNRVSIELTVEDK